ncbi:hypothetical protein ABFT23_14110 [Nocardioides sp. C4-1]|uniref:hypothetical protein n=1 Tax=Nocardioides sp. C4-1 TaxID=3151851 RepID=UPI00326633F7
MWNPRTWATASHERAIANARAASTECGRRRVERDDVALFLDSTGPGIDGDDLHTGAHHAEHPA